jgi:hypothetical protein
LLDLPVWADEGGVDSAVLGGGYPIRRLQERDKEVAEAMNGQKKMEEEFYATHRQSSGISRYYASQRSNIRRRADGRK